MADESNDFVIGGALWYKTSTFKVILWVDLSVSATIIDATVAQSKAGSRPWVTRRPKCSHHIRGVSLSFQLNRTHCKLSWDHLQRTTVRVLSVTLLTFTQRGDLASTRSVSLNSLKVFFSFDRLSVHLVFSRQDCWGLISTSSKVLSLHQTLSLSWAHRVLIDLHHCLLPVSRTA